MTAPPARPGLALAGLVREALAEDVGRGDVTTAATVASGLGGRARVIARAPGVIAGHSTAAEVYRQVDPAVEVEAVAPDGTPVEPGALVLRAEGPFRSLLVAERTVLNFLQRLSGIATSAARFVEAARGTGATIVDTRKTTPGWRALEKAAVLAGGAANHRMGLDDAYLIKENHVAAAGGVAAALAAVAAHNRDGLPVEIEVRSLAELEDALAADGRPDRILCDNFPPESLARAVGLVRGRAPGVLVEASGNVDLTTVRAIAATGVDWISVGAMTHSAPALDLSCRIEPQ